MQTPTTISNITHELRDLKRGAGPIIIGIEGFGGSGKSTTAELLKDALGSAFVVPMDDFIIRDKVLEPSWDKGAYDRARLEEQVLLPASEGHPVKYQQFLWDANALSTERVEIPDVDFLIIEGISAYHPSIATYYDYKIWIDTPIEVARERGRARDLDNENAAHWDLWAENDLRYLQAYQPDQVADAVISNGPKGAPGNEVA